MASGLTADAFCRGRPFHPARLEEWGQRLGAEEKPGADGVRLVRLVARPALPKSEATPLAIEVGAHRLIIRAGFDPSMLREVLMVLGDAQ